MEFLFGSKALHILNATGTAVIHVSTAWKINYVNPAAARLAGKEAPESLLGKDFWRLFQLFDPSDADRLRELGAGSARYEFHRIDRDAWAEVEVFPSDDGIALILSDVSDRKAAESRIRFLAEAGTALSSSLDYETTLQTVARLIVPLLADWCAVDMARPDGSIERIIVAHRDSDKIRWAREIQERYPQDAGAPHGVPAVIRSGKPELYPEITDEILARAAVDEEHLRIMKEVGIRSAMIVPLHVRGQVFGAMSLIWSESDHSYTQVDLEFVEQLARRSAMAVDNARLYRQAQEAESELIRVNESLEQRVAERTLAISEAHARLLSEVEERERAQMALALANRALESRNRELQDFAYIASHDLQEPLRKIRSFSSLLREEYIDQLQDGGAYLERIEDAAGRMSRLISDLLAFSRVATHQREKQPVDLSGIVQEVLGDLEVSIKESEAQVDVEPLCTVDADPVQIRQLFQNLIGNALKFRRAGVPPRVHVSTVITPSPTEGRTGDFCRITVTDNGIGFDEKYLDRIFSPFQRLHTRDAYPGTGMGLAICRRIAERHGGSVTARSTPGEGSTFEVLLPVHAGDSAPPTGLEDFSESQALENGIRTSETPGEGTGLLIV